MCTLSWLPLEGGYELLFSRDERHDRAPEVPAAVHDGEGTTYLAPTDSQAGGHWLAVNPHGLTVALLNDDLARPPAPGAPSRGHLVRTLASSPSAASALVRLQDDPDLERYPGFTLFLRDASGPARVVTVSHGALSVAEGDDLAPLSSSSLDPERARAVRGASWERLVVPAPSVEALHRFHLAAGPEGPDAFSPCMDREDAATRSLCRVQVSGDAVRLAHAIGRPDRARLPEPLVLART